jgi:hypothetical protein
LNKKNVSILNRSVKAMEMLLPILVSLPYKERSISKMVPNLESLE